MQLWLFTDIGDRTRISVTNIFVTKKRHQEKYLKKNQNESILLELSRAGWSVAQKVWQTSGTVATGVTVARGSHEF